jgi:hypothetical protein
VLAFELSNPATKFLGFGKKESLCIRWRDLPLPEHHKIGQQFVEPVDITGVVVKCCHDGTPVLLLIKIMDEVVASDMGLHQRCKSAGRRLQATPRLCWELISKIGTHHQHVGFVDRDEVAHRIMPVRHKKRIDGQHNLFDEVGKTILDFRLQPGITSQPGRVNKVMKRHDGLNPKITTCSQDPAVLAECIVIKGRRCPSFIDPGWLDATPLNTHPESVKSQRQAAAKILLIMREKAGGIA